MDLNDILTMSDPEFLGRSIAPASFYLKSLATCFSGSGLCPTKVWDGATPEQWAKALQDAETRLTYCDAAMADVDAIVKSISEGTSIGKDFILTYDCVLTSRRKDRDGDLLECKGFTIDDRMPGLWMHSQMQPIGAYVKTLHEDDDIKKGRFGILDTALGRDAAVLVKGGALRKSIGFRPSEFEPLEVTKGADGKQVVRGWHLKKGMIFEGSLVSVPANADAVITAYSQKALKTELFDRWAKQWFDARPATAPGMSLTTKGSQPSDLQSGKEKKPTEDHGKCPQCDSPLDSTGTCTNSACGHLTPKGMGGGCGGKGKAAKKCKDCGGKLDSDGNCPGCSEADGEKSLADLAKSGRVLSRANKTKLRAAAEAHALAAQNIKDVLDSSPDDDGVITEATEEKSLFHSLSVIWEKSLGIELKGIGAPADCPYLEGCFEWIGCQLSRTAKNYLAARGVDDANSGWCYVLATFPDRAVFCCNGNIASKCYQCDWEEVDGVPRWTGEPKEIRIQQSVVEKAAAVWTKGLAAAGQASPPAADPLTTLIEKAFTSDDAAGITLLESAHDKIKSTLSVLRQQQEDREWNEVFAATE
jgi:HK97 family phage prohead protease